MPSLTWSRVNCDQMMATEKKIEVPLQYHRPRMTNIPGDAGESVERIVRGFELACDVIVNHKDAVSQLISAMKASQIGRLRVLIRNSATYGEILEHLLKPQYLRNGIDRSIELEWLARPLSGPYKVRQGRQKVYENELLAMERMDIPHFTVSQWDAFGLADDEDFFRYHWVRDISIALDRLTSMSEQVRDEQVRIIRSVLVA